MGRRNENFVGGPQRFLHKSCRSYDSSGALAAGEQSDSAQSDEQDTGHHKNHVNRFMFGSGSAWP